MLEGRRATLQTALLALGHLPLFLALLPAASEHTVQGLPATEAPHCRTVPYGSAAPVAQGWLVPLQPGSVTGTRGGESS